MGLQMGRIHHQHRGVLASIGKLDQEAGKDPQPAPADLTIEVRLVRAIGGRRVQPAQTIAIDEYYSV